MSESARVGIVGLGHIGGSLALALREAGVGVIATSRSEATRSAAADAGLEVVDDVSAVVERSGVVVVAADLGVLGDVLVDVVEVVAAAGAEVHRPTVTDAGSVKAPLLERVRRDAARPDLYVPGHPMAGREGSGFASAVPDLFQDRTWALVPDPDAGLRRWAAVARVALAVGSTVVPVAAEEHDDIVALVSHLPYVLAALMAGAVDRGIGSKHPALTRALAAGSFDSLTRVAAGHDTLGAEMALGNAIALGDRIDDLRDSLELVREDLANGDAEQVREVFLRGREQREALMVRAEDIEPVEMTLDVEGLLALGRRGGRVLAAPGGDDQEVRVRVLDPGAGS